MRVGEYNFKEGKMKLLERLKNIYQITLKRGTSWTIKDIHKV